MSQYQYGGTPTFTPPENSEGVVTLTYHREPTTHEQVQELLKRVTSLEERLARIEQAVLRPESDR